MTESFDRRMLALIDEIQAEGGRRKLLLHCCCAPCSTAVLERLQSAFDITVFYHNPNIDTKAEHDLRAAEIKRLVSESGLARDAIATPYTPETFLDAVKGLERETEGGARCERCFDLRMREAANYAARNGFDYFTTTLSISPMKSAPLLNALGEDIARESGIAFLPSDFKKRGGYQRSVELSREYELYRQDYCGCAFSKREMLERRKGTAGEIEQ